jgi:acyl-CoA dehydrogenase
MLILELFILLGLIITLLFTRAKPWIWFPSLAIFLVCFSISDTTSDELALDSWIIFLSISFVFLTPFIRRHFFSRFIFNYFKKSLPPMSATEREAIEAGDVWWEGDLFSGRPDWKKLHAFPKPQLTVEEQAFLDNEVATLCAMLDDWKIVQEDCDMPEAVWQYLKDKGFFGLCIAKEYGGHGFSAFAHSSIVVKIASRSLSSAVNTMVPNSLGPAELLVHYGTEAQKNHYLPRLAKGTDIPCFALTGIDAGSDAGAMTDTGIICKGEFEGNEVLGIRLNWNKRYITLAPIATVMGLAFKLFDPNHLLGEKTDIGITLCLIPTNHPGVEIGRRHFPFGLAFMNGPIQGHDVFVPLDWIIGGAKMAGQGWRMLMECLSIGRGISLPSLSTAGSMLCYRTTGAYARLRRQFKVSLSEFEGVQEPLSRIAGNTYLVEACRQMTVGAVDLKVKPAVASAIAKYHTSEINRKIYIDAMDIHAGRAVQMGPRNYLAHGYMGIPIGITVEGANILTRNLIIFGQGAIRCHPYILPEMQAVNANDLKRFDKLLFSHLGFSFSNFVRCPLLGLTNACFIKAPKSPLKAYYQQLTRMSSALAMTADFAMLILGGALKRKESLSARLGDVLSYLYLGSCVLKYHADNGSPQEELIYVHWTLDTCLYEIQKAFIDFFRNFPNRLIAGILKFRIFPLGLSYKAPSDHLNQALATSMLVPSNLRDRLTYLCYTGSEGPLAQMEAAFIASQKADGLTRRIYQSIHDHLLSKEGDLFKHIDDALAAKIINTEEAALLRSAEIARTESLQVDDFEAGYFKNRHGDLA